ncbi:hypothetical protein [Aridibaculum aurantiacum]|uniref:hypothetical protein n=1 Tax=Aridibaculum aurantiacum TaxID=2810307 RepID=UPI001A9638D9|nr:hypothetical protein [Aridibaculum aurantiacum]
MKRNKTWVPLLFMFLAIAGLALSIYSLILETYAQQDFNTFKDVVRLLLFTVWMVDNYKRYKRMTQEKTV